MDVQGPAVVRPYTEKFQVTFPVAVDTADVFGRAFDLKAIPVTYLVDEVGIIRLQGGGPNDELLRRIREVLAEPLSEVRSQGPALAASRTVSDLEKAVADASATWQDRLALAERYEELGRRDEALAQVRAAAEIKPREPAIAFTWGMILLRGDERIAALAKLKEARDLDPKNWRIRKQIWAVEHPDKFYSGNSPDYGWQKEQLKRER